MAKINSTQAVSKELRKVINDVFGGNVICEFVWCLVWFPNYKLGTK